MDPNNKNFVFTKFGKTKTFSIGQKVKAIYYNEYENKKDAYKRSFLSLLIDKPFKPVKFGLIIGDAGEHPYWLSVRDGKFGCMEQYLFVKFAEYYLPKPIPISCLYDAVEAEENDRLFLQENMKYLGQKGYSQQSFDSLNSQLLNLQEFIK